MKNERFINIRKEIGLSQKEFGEKLEFSQSTIRDIENGKNKISPEMALKLLEKFGISVEYSLFGKFPKLEKDKQIEALNTLMSNYNLTQEQLEFITELLNNKVKLQAIMNLQDVIRNY